MSDLHPNEAIAIAVNDTAPDFTLLNTNGQAFTLTSAVLPLILVFYRGDW
jgi:peroxiredoxin